MAEIVYDRATRFYPGSNKPAVNALDLRINDGEFLVLVGPSGCGKSTTLRMLAGLEEVDKGHIRIGGRDVTHLPPKDRDIAMVFQSYALYPHMTVADNMAFALKIAGKPKEEIRQRVNEAAEILDLKPYLDRKPKALSGGQRQRVAMGRAIVRHPQVFLMDEPLSNLDAKLRVQTRTQIASLQRRLAITTVYVTHDQVEAMTMGDRVAVLKDGVLQQCDKPRTLYDAPANVFVAGFIGSPAMNLFTAPLDGATARLGPAKLALGEDTLDAVKAAGLESITVGVRPESFRLVGEGEGGDALPVEVTVVEELGADSFIYGTVRVGNAAQDIIARAGGRAPPGKGDTVKLVPKLDELHLFNTKTGARLPSLPRPATRAPRPWRRPPAGATKGHAAAANRRLGRPEPARPALVDPARRVAPEPARLAAPRHLEARGALRQAGRRGLRGQRGLRAPRLARIPAPAKPRAPRRARRRGGRGRHGPRGRGRPAARARARHEAPSVLAALPRPLRPHAAPRHGESAHRRARRLARQAAP